MPPIFFPTSATPYYIYRPIPLFRVMTHTHTPFWALPVYPPVGIDRQQLARHYHGRQVVITGASRGIGRVLTQQFIDIGARLFLIARNEEALQTLCHEARQRGCEADYYAIDLRERNDLEVCCKTMKEKLPVVDFLFCNAGKSIRRRIEASVDRLHDFDRTMDLNYRASVALSIALLPALQRSGGRIIYVSSVSTLYPSAPAWSAYHASKCAANTWYETAAVELRPRGIQVQIAYLPLVHTGMSDVTETYSKIPAYSPEQAARILLRLSMQRRFTYKPWWARLSAPIAHLLSPLLRMLYSRLL